MQIQAEEEREESQCDTVRSDSENRIILPQIPGDGGAVHRGGGEGQLCGRRVQGEGRQG